MFQVIAMIAALLFPTLPRRGSRTLWVQKGGEGGFADGDVQTHRFKIPLGPPRKLSPFVKVGGEECSRLGRLMVL